MRAHMKCATKRRREFFVSRKRKRCICVSSVHTDGDQDDDDDDDDDGFRYNAIFTRARSTKVYWDEVYFDCSIDDEKCSHFLCGRVTSS